MYRHGSESGFKESPHDMSDGNDHDGNPLNRSYNSGMSGASANRASASSSKAVLAALRALQDKIRRLETERAQALDETSQLRHQLKNQEIESDHLNQRDSLASQKNLHEVRSAYERLLTEKTELEIRLSKLEDRNREEQQIADGLRCKIQNIEDEKHDGLLGIKDLEGERIQLQGQIQYSQQKEKDLGQTILWETKRHEEDMDVLSSKLRNLQNDLSGVIHEKSVVETKLVELDQLVGQLLSVNESLVVRLSGKPLPKGPTPKGTIIRKKKVPVPSQKSPVLVQVPLHLSASAQGALHDVKNLHGMHKMYVDLAHSITDPTSTVKKTRRASSGGDISGKQLRSSTLIGGKKSEGPRSYGDDSVNVRIPSVTFDRYNDDSINEGHYLNTSQSGSGVFRAQNGDLQGVITSLEEEFLLLNDQYRSLLSTVQTQQPSVESSQAEDLVAVIQKLHKKGEQLRALKSPPRR